MNIFVRTKYKSGNRLREEEIFQQIKIKNITDEIADKPGGVTASKNWKENPELYGIRRSGRRKYENSDDESKDSDDESEISSWSDDDESMYALGYDAFYDENACYEAYNRGPTRKQRKRGLAKQGLCSDICFDALFCCCCWPCEFYHSLKKALSSCMKNTVNRMKRTSDKSLTDYLNGLFDFV